MEKARAIVSSSLIEAGMTLILVGVFADTEFPWLCIAAGSMAAAFGIHDLIQASRKKGDEE